MFGLTPLRKADEDSPKLTKRAHTLVKNESSLLANPQLIEFHEYALKNARTIQRFVKRLKGATTKKIVEVFCGGGPTIEKVKSIR